jgi:hypothetical protein
MLTTKIFLLLFSVTICAGARAQQNVFSLKEIPAIIEGMTYDPVGKNFLFGESTKKRILKYTRTGQPAGVIDAVKDGMTSVLGMTVNTKTHHLWICGAIDTGINKTMCIFQYDLANNRLVKKLPDTSKKAKLFNDVTITSDGSVFVTDSYDRSIYTADTVNGIMVRYLQNDLLRDANGITSHGDTMYVSTSRGITRITTKDKQITSLPLDEFMIVGIDGLYYYKNSVIGIQNVIFPISINRFYLDNKINRLSKGKVLASDHASFVIPTTGAIVDDEFYFMSNNNIGTEDASAHEKVNMKKVKPVTVSRISLTN